MPGDMHVYQTTVSGRDAHLDVPLTNIAIKAFQGADDFIATKLFPPVPMSNPRSGARDASCDHRNSISTCPGHRKRPPRPRASVRVGARQHFSKN